MHSFTCDHASVHVYKSKLDTSRAAAAHAGAVLRKCTSSRGRASIIVGTGLSQLEMIDALVREPNLDWHRIEVFHMDEHVGLPETHPASFRRWLKVHLADVVHPGRVHYLNGDAADSEQECKRYGELLRSAPIDICFLGFGENGHIGFNDPHVAKFDDPFTVKRVELDVRSRMQQVGEGNFPHLELVPLLALTVTCPTLVGAEHLICCVPERRKAEAVRAALRGPITPLCPASIVRTHPRAFIFLDADSSSLLQDENPDVMTNTSMENRSVPSK